MSFKLRNILYKKLQLGLNQQFIQQNHNYVFILTRFLIIIYILFFQSYMDPQQQKKIQAKIQQLHKKFFPLVKFLRKKKLKIKYARLHDRQIEYFRIDQYQKVIKEHEAQVKKILSIETDPLQQIKQSYYYLTRPSNTKALKYPQVLQFSKVQTQFASFKFPIQESRRWLMFLIIAAILFLVLFPIWPYELKYVIWLISLYLLIFLTALIVVRLVIYLLLSVFGISFWIFPNLLSDSSFIDSFKPLYSTETWEKSSFNFILRVIMFTGFIYYGYDIYLNPTIFYENIQNTKSAVNDIHDWGVSKIKGQTNFSQRALTNLADILNETEVKQQVVVKEQQIIDQNTQTTQQEKVNVNNQINKQQTVNQQVGQQQQKPWEKEEQQQEIDNGVDNDQNL